MNKTVTVALIVALLLAGAAVALYVRSTTLGEGAIGRIGNTVSELRRIENQRATELVQVSTNSQSDFDGLAAYSPRVFQLKRELVGMIGESDQLVDDDKRSLRAFAHMIDGRDERIERFKSGYAIVRNSQRFLPTAANGAADTARAQDQGELANAITSQLAGLTDYLRSPSEVEKQKLLLELGVLREQSATLAASLSRPISNFVAHATVLLQQKGPMDELFRAATGPEIEVEADRLVARVAQLRDQAETAKRWHELAALALILVAFGLLAVAFAARVKRASARSGADERDADEAASRSSQEPVAPSVSNLATERLELNTAMETEAQKITARVLLEDIEQAGSRLHSHIRLLGEVDLEVNEGLDDALSAVAALRDTGRDDAPDDAASPAAGVDPTFEERLADVTSHLAQVRASNTAAKLVEAMNRESERILEAVEALSTGDALGSARQEDWLSVNDCVTRALKLSGLDEIAKLRLELSEVPPILGVEAELTSAFAHLFSNCADALGENPQIRVKSEQQDDAIAVTIVDNGIGMDSATRKSATTMYFSTKQDGRGLGLNIVSHLVKQHGGHMMLNSVTNKGTAVRVLLPTGELQSQSDERSRSGLDRR
ncbi:MAG: sensor histidine kinase [Gammaproteobacteria bacterium]|nr:sensor histidine kinase [Gammaproteobacteria bacterium]